MNDEGTEIEAGAAGAPEGAVAVAPTTDEVSKMYDELGVKAPAPTGAVKGRPKSSKVRAKDVSDDNDDDSKPGRKDKESGEDKSKDAPAPTKDGDAGDKPDAKSKEVGKDSGEVSDEPAKTDAGVRKPKSTAEKAPERGSEEDADEGDNGLGDEEQSEESEEEGKRPGKSDPKVERRFQKLTTDVRDRDELIEKLQKELQETTQQQRQDKVSHEDPEYTIDDFRRVRDEDGNVIDLDEDRAELAHRRWKDGFDQRKSEREAAEQHQLAADKRQSDMSDQIMRSSVEAYDTLTSLMDDYPQLVSTSGQFDKEFADQAMPIIQDSMIYQPGTEPGNAEGLKPVIMGLKMNPKRLLDAMSSMQKTKRSLPLNGVNDNVEARSNVSVTHGRSSDSTVNAANDLMKQLKINKRF